MLMTMHKVIWDVIRTDYIYQEKEGVSGLTRIEDSVEQSIQEIEEYIKRVKRG